MRHGHSSAGFPTYRRFMPMTSLFNAVFLMKEEIGRYSLCVRYIFYELGMVAYHA